MTNPKANYKFISIKAQSLKKVSDFLNDLGNKNVIHLNPSLKFLKWKYQYNYFAKNTAFLKAIMLKNKIAGICGYLPFKLITPLGIKKTVWGMDILFDKEAVPYPFMMIQAGLNEAKNLKKEGVFSILTFSLSKVLFENWQKWGFLPIDFYSLECRLTHKVNYGEIRNITVKSLKKFNNQFDVLFKRISGQYDFITQRSREYLNWRYKEHPYHKYVIFAAFDHNNEMLAYLVARKEKQDNSGYILDILGDLREPKHIYAVILKGLEYFKKNSCYRIQTALANKTYMRIFKKVGFLPLRKEFCLFWSEEKQLKKIFYLKKKWHLTMGDGDFRGCK